MTSEKQLEANRQNVLKSTGPLSIEGKSRASKNAMKRGVLSTNLDKLINHSLVFRVEKDFQIKETTGHLTQIY